MIESLVIDDSVYQIEKVQKVTLTPEAPRLLVVSYLPNKLAVEILKACLNTIQNITRTPHEVWVIDNNSPADHSKFLRDRKDVNVVFNYTTPSPENKYTLLKKGWALLKRGGKAGKFGSYANGVALEIGARCIDPKTKFLMSLHMDTMPVHPDWLQFLCGKIDHQTKAAGVRLDDKRVKEGILHVLGYLFDFSLYKKLGLTFLPDLPELDVGDQLIVDLKKAGYTIFACRNTLWQPELADLIPASSPLRAMQVDRSFDDDGRVIFLHLGRGVVKSTAGSSDLINRWLEIARRYEKISG